MASAWTDNGPVALPPKPLAMGVGAALFLLACVGVGLGLRASWKESGAPELGAASASSDSADTLIAKPIVDLPPAPTANAANEVIADKDQSSDAIDEKTAEAQRIQAMPSKSGGDIDQILASPSEKPPPSAKPATDETPPGPPVKSDVPF